MSAARPTTQLPPLLDRPLRGVYRGLRTTGRLGVLASKTRDVDLVRRALGVRSLSRSVFNGWAYNHRSRLWEYPWVLREVELRLGGRTPAAMDVGAGKSPVPVAFARMGLRTLVVDPGLDEAVPSWDPDAPALNSWGLVDYSRFGIESQRAGMEDVSVEPGSFGFAVCISVIEHVPAAIRRAGLKRMAEALEDGGVVVLTVDVRPGTERLHNLSMNVQVESPEEHGGLDDLIEEARGEDLLLEKQERSPLSAPIADVVGLTFRKSGAA